VLLLPDVGQQAVVVRRAREQLVQHIFDVDPTSRSCRLALLTKVIIFALCSHPATLHTNSQALRLCGAPHNRNYAESHVMRSCGRIGRFLQGHQCPQLRIFRSRPVDVIQHSVYLHAMPVPVRRPRKSN
jgi:hypothetical protein